jgi:hypothetical protein
MSRYPYIYIFNIIYNIYIIIHMIYKHDLFPDIVQLDIFF